MGWNSTEREGKGRCGSPEGGGLVGGGRGSGEVREGKGCEEGPSVAWQCWVPLLVK